MLHLECVLDQSNVYFLNIQQSLELIDQCRKSLQQQGRIHAHSLINGNRPKVRYREHDNRSNNPPKAFPDELFEKVGVKIHDRGTNELYPSRKDIGAGYLVGDMTEVRKRKLSKASSDDASNESQRNIYIETLTHKKVLINNISRAGLSVLGSSKLSEDIINNINGILKIDTDDQKNFFAYSNSGFSKCTHQ